MTVISRQSPRIFLLNADKLLQIKESRTSGDRLFDSAINQLSQIADKALKDGPFRVGERPQPDALLSPEGDKHDYFSLAPYWWPNPNTPDGLPYIRKDGERNPDTDKIPDAKNLNGMVNSVARLTLAYYFTGKEVYAKHAADLLRIWFLAENTRMNPNMAYAQVIMGMNDGYGKRHGIIEAHGFIYVVDSIGLLAESKDWNLKDQYEIQQWFSQYLEWLLTSDNGKDEAEASNNHATWYAAQAAAIALFLDKKEIVTRCLQRIQALIADQIKPDGQQPLETERRTQPWYYSTFNLNGLFHVAALAERVGIDLWNYRTADDRSIRKALDYLVPFVLNPSKWPYKKDISKNIGKDKNITVLLRQASVRYRDQQYLEIIQKSYQLDELDKLNMLIGWCVREAWD
ncbi:alginate lyase family protein [Nostoc sp. LPT]|uniref:alginate lyase family protein n=1 Tax=Nostoc sp. LPT TaxID=2815387 RepID=UPI001DB03889|nr:alginate lyase family protein [Nostoc sp. LPT]MBN4003197.1 alginate lyase family protein [Nostoc sp. LPT]